MKTQPYSPHEETFLESRHDRPARALVSAEEIAEALPSGLRDDAPSRGKLTDRAYQHIRLAILQGRYAVGSAVAEGAIAAELGISKTPVRQALQMLSREGLLEVGKRRQLIVRGFTPEHREEILEIREALENIAVRRACAQMSVDDIDYLRILVMRQRRAIDANDDDRFVELDEEFHLRIAEGSGLAIVTRILGQLRGFVRVMRLGSTRVRDARSAIEEHEAIIEAIEARDATAATAALHLHLRRSSNVERPGVDR
jgi:GntR family transcriptional regulator, rspAB operon transcriptional repressor